MKEYMYRGQVLAKNEIKRRGMMMKGNATVGSEHEGMISGSQSAGSSGQQQAGS
jgi:hypothetical protein